MGPGSTRQTEALTGNGIRIPVPTRALGQVLSPLRPLFLHLDHGVFGSHDLEETYQF